MKKILTLAVLALCSVSSGFAQGWPANYGGVMLQGFSWDSYNASQWNVLGSEAGDMKGYIDLVWVPQSGRCLETTQVMGYTPYYYFDQNSSFGTETELRSMISTFKSNGIGTIADVVINHHNTTGWFGFPAETYNGVTYQLNSTDVCSDDDGGSALTEATKEGVSLSSNKDDGKSGDCDWSGMRDLDHKSSNVQTVIKAYENFLVNDLGYTGFRYDMVKGYAASHVGDYNNALGIQYSVGEYWDGNSLIESWINGTKVNDVIQSAAFDFQFRYNVRDAINQNDWRKLNSTNNLMHDANYRRYAVTFVENHDTQYRSATETLDPIKRDTLAANAYMLAMPGTPCIFQPHWLAYENELKGMIAARKCAGINNQSDYEFNSSNTYLTCMVTGKGTNCNLVAVVGYNTDNLTPGSAYTKVLSGYHYRYYLANKAETAWASVQSGSFEDAFNVTLTAVSQTSSAQLVYTTDGSTPTAKSTKVESGSSIAINASCTLTVGLLINGVVSGIQTYSYDIKKFEPYNATVYVNVDDVKWSKVNFHIWGDITTTTGSWPGKTITDTKVVNGRTYYYYTVTINKKNGSFGIVVNTNSGSPQTVDKTGITSDIYLNVLSTQTSGKYMFEDATSTVTGVSAVYADEATASDAEYNLSGVRVGSGYHGIIIKNGRKFLK